MSYKDTGITIKTSKGKTALNLKKAISAISDEIATEADEALTESLEESALWAVQQLRTTAVTKRWRYYPHGWTYSREGKKGKTFKVYNKDHYQLTHLLEKGHRIVTHDGRDTGKRAPAFPHIAPVNDQLPDKVDELFAKNLNERGL